MKDKTTMKNNTTYALHQTNNQTHKKRQAITPEKNTRNHKNTKTSMTGMM